MGEVQLKRLLDSKNEYKLYKKEQQEFLSGLRLQPKDFLNVETSQNRRPLSKDVNLDYTKEDIKQGPRGRKEITMRKQRKIQTVCYLGLETAV